MASQPPRRSLTKSSQLYAQDLRRRRGLDPRQTCAHHQRHAPPTRTGPQVNFEILDANNGEIWGKLDAGTEAYYQAIDRSKVKLAEVLENLVITARRAADRDSIAVHAAQQPAAADRRARGLLRSAPRNRRRTAGRSSWCRFTPSPAEAGRELCLSAGKRRSRCPGGFGQEVVRGLPLADLLP